MIRSHQIMTSLLGIDLICHLLTIIMIYRVRLWVALCNGLFCGRTFRSNEYLTLALWSQGKELQWWWTCYSVQWTRSVFHYCLNKSIWLLKNLVFIPVSLINASTSSTFPNEESTIIRVFFLILQGHEFLFGASDDWNIISFIFLKAYQVLRFTQTFFLFFSQFSYWNAWPAHQLVLRTTVGLQLLGDRLLMYQPQLLALFCLPQLSNQQCCLSNKWLKACTDYCN